MNDFQIFNSDEFERMKSIENTIKSSYLGFIYFLEYGENIKIGYSQKPSNRMKQLKNQAEYGKIKLGNVAISKPHTNYRENEKLLHQYFNQSRIAGTELFSVTLKQILSDLPKDLKFLDESEKLEQESEERFKFIMGILFPKLGETESRISCTQEQLDHVENLHITQKKEVFLMQEKNNSTPAQKKSSKRQKIGERTHIYRNADGSIFGKKIVNKFSDGSKNALWYLFNPETNCFNTRAGLSGATAPLYNFNILHNNKDNTEHPIVIVEGEKDVETLANMEILATSLPNGGQSKQWHELYNDGLQGHDIIILTDNDKTGETYGQTVAKNVIKIAKSVKVVSAKTIWSECPEKGDISDIAEALGQDKTIELLLNATRKAESYIDISDFEEILHDDPPFSPPKLIVKKGYEFEKKDIRYVWYPYIPAGDYTVLMAAGGTGKTYFACGIAATISKGEALPVPDEYKSKKIIPENKNVLIISAEDRGSDIWERLEKSGADVEYIHIADKKLSNGFLFPRNNEDTPRIDFFEDVIERCTPNLIIIDPWHAFCPPEIDVNRINHVRPIFQTISTICEKYDCGLILISHINKKPQENANNAALGSVDLVNASRSALTIVSDSNDKNNRFVVHTKINHAAHGQTIRFRIDDDGFAWNGFEPSMTKDTLEDAARMHRKPSEEIKDQPPTDEEVKEDLLETITELAECGKETKIAYQQLESMLEDKTFRDFNTSKKKSLIEEIAKSEEFQSKGMILKGYSRTCKYTDDINGQEKYGRGIIISHI